MAKEQIPLNWVIGRQLSQDQRSSHMNCAVDTGIRHTAFLSFYEDERKTRINSAQSFDSWRNHQLPLLAFRNDFIEGWKILSDYRRSTTRHLFIVQEPRFKHQFEIPVDKIIPMLKNINIIDGVLQGKWALRRDRSLISEVEYQKLTTRTPWQPVGLLNKFDVITMKGKPLIYMGKLKRVTFEFQRALHTKRVDLKIHETQSFIRFSDNIMSQVFAQSRTLPKVNIVRHLTEEERAKAEEYFAYYIGDGHHWMPHEQELIPLTCVGTEVYPRFAYGHFCISRTGTLYFCLAELREPSVREPREGIFYQLVRAVWNPIEKCFDLDIDSLRVASADSHKSSGIEPISIVFK